MIDYDERGCEVDIISANNTLSELENHSSGEDSFVAVALMSGLYLAPATVTMCHVILCNKNADIVMEKGARCFWGFMTLFLSCWMTVLFILGLVQYNKRTNMSGHLEDW